MKFDLRLFAQAWRSKFLWLGGVELSFSAGLLVIFQAYLLSSLLERVFLLHQSRAEVLPLFAGLVAALLAKSLAASAGEYFSARLAVQVKQRLRIALFEHISALGPAYVNGQKSGELITKATLGIEALDAYFSQYLPQLILAAMLPVAILVAVFPGDFLSGLIMLLTAPLIPVFMILIGKASEITTGKQWLALNQLSDYFLDTIQGLRELRQLGQGKARATNVARVAEKYRLTTMQVLRVTFLSAFALEFIATLSTAIIAVQIGLRLLDGDILFRQAFFILVLAPEFYAPLRMLGQRFHAGMNGVTAAVDIFEVLETPVDNPPLVDDRADRLFQKEGDLVFERVSFVYPQRDLAAVEDLNFRLRQGSMTALVGRSGAGKSTVAQLVMQFIRPQSGQLVFAGQPLLAYPADEWRRLVTWVPQRPYLFNTSIGANIALENPQSAREEIFAAAEKAHLADFILSLPEGLDTRVGEQGTRLSGGQAQRVALARAFFRHTPLLVMDEPTAHLDPELEAWLQESVAVLCKRRTSLVIAHRLPTILQADTILVMENGRLIESGDHSTLLAQPGLYAGLIQAYGGAG